MITYTRSGTIDILDPHPDDIRLSDIAPTLAYIARWGGQIPQFYSVADHSLAVAAKVTPEYRLHALLHDAHEAYMGDVPAPMRAGLFFISTHGLNGCERRSFESVEGAMQAVIFRKFGIADTLPEEVHAADMLQRAWEAREVLTGNVGGDRNAGVKWLEQVQAELHSVAA